MTPLLSQYRKPEAHTVQWPGCPTALTPKRLTRRALLGSWGAGGLGVKVFFLLCVLIAGLYGAVTASRKILFVQALPAALGLVLVWLSRAS